MSLQRNRPTEQAWEQAKDRIETLYLFENRTLGEVRQVLACERGFVASERMYKQRLNRWGFDRKTIKDAEYEAMGQVYETRRIRDGKDTFFDVRKATGRKIMGIAHVRKHDRRVDRQGRQQTGNAWGDGDPIQFLISHAIIPFTPSASPTLVPVDSPVARTGSVSSSSSSDFMLSQQSNHSHRLETETMANTYSKAQYSMPYRHCDNREDMQQRQCSCIGGMRATCSLHGIAPSLLLPPDYSAGCPDQSPSRSIRFQPAQFLRRVDIKQADLDLKSAFGRVSLHQMSSSRTQPRSLGGFVDVVPIDQEKSVAEDWVAHIFETCIMTDNKCFQLAGEHRYKARNQFRQMLRNANQYILPSLNHMACVLGGLGQYENYRMFLDDCCQVMTAEQVQGLPYAIPFRYALAWEMHEERQDQEVLNALYAELVGSMEECGSLSGHGSPNLLVSLYYQAFHLAEFGKANEAVLLLKRCLDTAEIVLERCHLLVINCLSILGRAYGKLGHHHLAVDALCDAAERCKAFLGPQNPFRLEILERLAKAQIGCGLPGLAESNMLEVLSGRRQTLGPGHGHTWWAWDILASVMTQQGKSEEAQKVRTNLLESWDPETPIIAPREAYMGPQ